MKERIPRKRKKLIKKLAKATAHAAKLAVDLLVKGRYDTSVIPFIVDKDCVKYNSIKVKED